MQPHQIFNAMSQEDSERILGRISDEAPEVFRQTVATAAAALKFRPQYLMKQPASKRVSAFRRPCRAQRPARPPKRSLPSISFSFGFNCSWVGSIRPALPMNTEF